jgi:hypothetical protein
LDGIGDMAARRGHPYLDFIAFEVVNPNVDIDYFADALAERTDEDASEEGALIRACTSASASVSASGSVSASASASASARASARATASASVSGAATATAASTQQECKTQERGHQLQRAELPVMHFKNPPASRCCS